MEITEYRQQEAIRETMATALNSEEVIAAITANASEAIGHAMEIFIAEAVAAAVVTMRGLHSFERVEAEKVRQEVLAKIQGGQGDD